jgi:hypothetical protein
LTKIWWRRPRLGECSLAAAQENPGSFTHVSSTISSAPSSSSSSSTSSLSSQSDSSSLSHLPASLSSDSSGCNSTANANLSVASIPAEVFSNDNELEYYSPKRSPRDQYTPNQSGNSGHQRRRLRECIPLISNNHWQTKTFDFKVQSWIRCANFCFGQWAPSWITHILQVIILTRTIDWL